MTQSAKLSKESVIRTKSPKAAVVLSLLLSLSHSLALAFVLKVTTSVRLPLRSPKLARHFPHHIEHKIRCSLPNLVRISSHKEQHANKLGSTSMPLGDARNGHEVEGQARHMNAPCHVQADGSLTFHIAGQM